MYRRTLTDDQIFHHQNHSKGKDIQKVLGHQVNIWKRRENLTVLVSLIVFGDDEIPLVSKTILGSWFENTK